MSHKGIFGIIIGISLISVGVYSTMAILDQQEPIQMIINSIQQDTVTENISLTDEAIVKKGMGVHTDEWGRVKAGTNGTDHHVIINDGVMGTVTQE